MKSQGLELVSHKRRLFVFLAAFCFVLLLSKTEAGAFTGGWQRNEVGATSEVEKEPSFSDPISAGSGAYYFTMPLAFSGRPYGFAV